MEIIYEDKNIILVNKPLGILSHSDGVEEHSIEGELLNYFNGQKVFLINRLDKDTSGIIMFAKNQKSAAYFSEVFSNHNKVKKTYLTLVSGVISEEGKIDAPIRKNFQMRKMVVAPTKSGGKEALTLYKPSHQFEDSTLLEVNILTGRTHQIRVHMSYIKHHVIGDYKYGDFKINNIYKNKYNLLTQFLHSYKLSFTDLDSQYSYLNGKEFIANLPELFLFILKDKGLTSI